MNESTITLVDADNLDKIHEKDLLVADTPVQGDVIEVMLDDEGKSANRYLVVARVFVVNPKDVGKLYKTVIALVRFVGTIHNKEN